MTKTAHIFLDEELASELDSLKILGRKRPQIIAGLLREYKQAKGELPIATFENLIVDPVPAVIVGRPYEGKSYSMDKFLQKVKAKKIPFLLFDSNSDHLWVTKKISFYEALTQTWLESPGSYRIEFEKDLDLRRSAVREMSKAILRLENDSRIASWVIGVEEAHDYSKIESFLTLLRRMRKSTKKLVIISTEAELFRMCKPFRPLPKI